ncbi:MAG: hypothetical protein UU62_C0021G0019 [Candidatus Uhrbacteria bacterium GW2011_GWF2_41_40]|nr:MAG: hypothetical protein UU62_C0021G0019 [Candidatus Uhrbacteria bacterium GW2011_GWF2_41_40]
MGRIKNHFLCDRALFDAQTAPLHGAVDGESELDDGILKVSVASSAHTAVDDEPVAIDPYTYNIDSGLAIISFEGDFIALSMILTHDD